jgi:hypothetical protein
VVPRDSGYNAEERLSVGFTSNDVTLSSLWVLAKRMLRLQPQSTSIFPGPTLQMVGLITKVCLPEFGTVPTWSCLEKVIGTSDQNMYSGVHGMVVVDGEFPST